MAYRVGALGCDKTVVDGEILSSYFYNATRFGASPSTIIVETTSLPSGLYFDHWVFSYTGSRAPDLPSAKQESSVISNPEDAPSTGGHLIVTLHLTRNPGGGGGGDVAIRRIYVRTDPDDPSHGTTSPNQGEYGVVASGSVYDNFDALVTLTATPAPGWRFLRWDGVTPGDRNPINVRYIYEAGDPDNKARAIAYFTQDLELTMAVDPVGGGTISPDVGTYSHKVGDVVTVSATPEPGWRFEKWSDGGDQTHDVELTDDTVLTAYFRSLDETYTITAVPDFQSRGQVTGGGVYHYGDVVTLTATPMGDNVFVGWSDGSTEQTRFITVTGNASYIAQFQYVRVLIPCRVNQTGTGTITGDGGDYTDQDHLFYSVRQPIRANPKKGYRFIKWEDGTTDPVRVFYPRTGMRIVAYFGNDKLFHDVEGGLLIHGNNGNLVYSG